ncbi:hypothetical protein BJ742DRAFT_854523 [Cladochytrium replicatum]|nr:hypothetical protein BJ742DRAFT_854523 [Cladochytrium replicatum]
MSGTRLNKLPVDADASLIKKYGYVTDDEPGTPSKQRKKSADAANTVSCEQSATGAGYVSSNSARTTAGSATIAVGVETKATGGVMADSDQHYHNERFRHDLVHWNQTTGVTTSGDSHTATRLVTKITLIPTTVTTKPTKTTKTITEEDPTAGKQVKTIITTKKVQMKIGENEVELLGSTMITEVFVKRGEDGENVKVSETLEEEEVALEDEREVVFLPSLQTKALYPL